MMTQDEAKLRIEKTIRNYRFMQETHMVDNVVSDSLDERIDASLIALDAINKLQEIQKIVDEYDNMPEGMKYHADYHSLINGTLHKILAVVKENR